jgi:hypothetical protein
LIHVRIFQKVVEQINRTQTDDIHYAVTGRRRTVAIATSLRFPLLLLRMQRNDRFIGRKIQLAKLQDVLLKPGPSAGVISCAVEGVGGVGKTETVLEYCYQFASHYDVVLWASAASETTLRRDFGYFGRSLHLFDTDDSQVTRREIQSVINWLETERKTRVCWLCLFVDLTVHRTAVASCL